MPTAPRGRYLVPFVLMGCSAVLRFWLATELADLKRRQNDPTQQAVGIDRIASPVGKDRPCFRFSEACAMRLAVEKLDEFRDDLIRRFFHQPVPGFTNDHAFNICRPDGKRSSIVFMISSAHRTASAIALRVAGTLFPPSKLCQLTRSEDSPR
jgi:hypothetical protein